MQSYNPAAARHPGLGCSLFARHYSGNHYCFLFLSLLRCFSSGGWLSFEYTDFIGMGCPIRIPGDIALVCSSPRLFAAYHVLHRLLLPRHPPSALYYLNRVIRPCSNALAFVRTASPLAIRALLSLFLFFCQRSPAIPLRLSGGTSASCLSGGVVEMSGLEPPTSCVQGRRSPS